MRFDLRALAIALTSAVWVLAHASPALAIPVESDRATFTWAPASGPVAGYNVFVTRNGSASSTPETSVSTSMTTVQGTLGDSISIRVAAFDAAGNVGPLSAESESVELTPPPGPAPVVVVESLGDFSVEAALAAGAPGELVIAYLHGDGDRQFFDVAPPDEFAGEPDEWGLDQIVVGEVGRPATVRLIDAVGLGDVVPLEGMPPVTLFGLGNGPPCARDGEAGLVLNPGSTLVLGGIELFAFDGESCVRVNDLFPGSPDPNVVAWDAGEIHLHGDLEQDGVLDPDDNCLLADNPDQCDGNANGFGNACDFDIDGDGAVSSKDLGLVVTALRDHSSDAAMDSNCNGAVDMKDLGMALKSLGSVPGPSGLACAAEATCGVR